MDLEKIKKFIELAKEQGLAELKVESGDEKYSLKLPCAVVPNFVSTPAMPMAQGTVEDSGQAAIASKPNDGLLEVTSPFVGTFYRASSPDVDAYVKVGDRIGNGQVLCIVEAMKIMNEIESEISGEIDETQHGNGESTHSENQLLESFDWFG